jgi:threonyl-tRNA synthetase
MFTTESEKRDFAIKPMNCPGHVQVFNSQMRSYRDLPLRYGEFGACHRNEPSAPCTDHAVRAFTQDDGHIFCAEDHIEPECVAFHRLALQGLRRLRLPGRDGQARAPPEKRIGSEEQWDKAEEALRAALRACGRTGRNCRGGRLLRPKIEYHLKDSIGRSWQVGTMQVDFMMPGAWDREYVAEDNTRRIPSCCTAPSSARWSASSAS